jgi:hypothetical protein
VPLCESTVPRVGHYTEANSCVLTCRNKERNKISKHTSFIVCARSISHHSTTLWQRLRYI